MLSYLSAFVIVSGTHSAGGHTPAPPWRFRLKPQRPGFSLIEALVVLAISGMALAVIFTIGTKAGDTGFGLGRRAMDASEGDIAISDLRSLVRSVALRPPVVVNPKLDTPVLGTAERFEADVVLERANQCGPLGWAGRMTLSIETDGARRQLVCDVAGRKTPLIELGGRDAAFAYSRDGRTWSPTYTNARQDGVRTELRSETLWVRLASPGFGDIIEAVSSGAPDAWLRPTDEQ